VHALQPEVEPGPRLERGDAHEVDALALAAVALRVRPFVRACPDARPDRRVVEAELLGELAAQRVLVCFTWVDPAARARPDAVAEMHQDGAAVGVENERADAAPPRPQRTSARSAANQRRRSSHGTAAFAGEVDGSTKRRVA